MKPRTIRHTLILIKKIPFLVWFLLLGFQSVYSQTPEENKKTKDSTKQKSSETEINLLDMLTDDGGLYETTEEETQIEDEKPKFWREYVFNPMRFGISYELTYKFTKPDEVIKNRLSYRLEYSKFLFNKIFLQLDTKLFTFLEGDARSRDLTFFLNDDESEASIAFGSITRNAFAQYSFGKSNVVVGIQTLAWGESDFAAVTDEINPFDFRDPLNLNIDELRVGQFMFTFNTFSSIGNWSMFFVPSARFNLSPEEGTRFFVDPFPGRDVTFQDDTDNNLFEYGLRWKKTFGKSDISIIATSLIDNNIIQEEINTDIISTTKRRYTTLGIGFNYAINNLLIRGEAAVKFPRAYNDINLQVIERNALDATLSFEYAPNSTTTLGLELVNNHILDYTDAIVGFPRNNYSAFFIVGKQFLKNTLEFNCISLLNWPYTTSFSLLSTSYELNDHINLSLDTLIPLTNDERSAFFQFREQQQFALKIQYLF